MKRYGVAVVQRAMEVRTFGTTYLVPVKRPRWRPVRRRFWTARGAERYALMMKREAWRSGSLLDATVRQLVR